MSDRTLEQNVRFYDTESEVYDCSRYGTPAGRRVDLFHKTVLDNMLCAELSNTARVLEIGCGTGRLIEHIASHGYEVYGMDCSENMLALARKRLGTKGLNNVTFVRADARRMPFHDDSFDAIYGILVVNLIPNYLSLFESAARVLKSDGIFLFNVPNLLCIYLPAAIYVNIRRKTTGSNKSGYRYSHWFLPNEWRRPLLGLGFDIEEILGQPPGLKISTRVPIKPLERWATCFSPSVYIKARLKSARKRGCVGAV
ncbi:MAG: class I SAM-dependent methyltransferase [bacterium]|nr:class I SAM-dependent methyltransferase [bacterium]